MHASFENKIMMIEWTVNNEIQLFHAMTGHKPIGINKHFQMLMIHSKLSESLHTEVSSRIIWDKLRTLYDLTALEDSDKQQFPIADGLEFTLPSDYLQNVSSPADPTASSEGSNNTENTPSQSNSVPSSESSSTISSRQTPSRSNPSSTSVVTTSNTKATPTSAATPASRSLSSSASGHRHSSPYSSRFTSAVNSPGRALNGKDSDQHTPKPRVHSRASNESKDGTGTPTPSSMRRRPNVEEASEDATPRRPKRGRDSKSGSPVPGSASVNKRRKV